MLSELSKINPSSEGIDLDSGAIEFAKSRGLNAEFIDLFSLKDNTRDFIIMSHTLEHLEDISKIIEKISNILVEGGYLLIFVPDSYKMREPPHLPHNYCFSRETLSSILSKSSLKEVEYFPPNSRPKGFEIDLISLFRKDKNSNRILSHYPRSKFKKYKHYLKIYSVINPILMTTNTKEIARGILRACNFL